MIVSHTQLVLISWFSLSVCVMSFVSLRPLIQSVSALVQPLGVGAEYLNSSLVQVSYPVCTNHSALTLIWLFAWPFFSNWFNSCYCLYSPFYIHILFQRWNHYLCVVYMTPGPHSDFYPIFICRILLLFCCCSGPCSPQGSTKFHIVFS